MVVDRSFHIQRKNIRLLFVSLYRFVFFCSEFKDDIDASVSYVPNEPDLVEPALKDQSNNNMMDRLLGCAYGQALGDAYGLSTEFETREKVKHKYPDASAIIPFPDYILTSHSRRWKRGDWTDDTDQWILILETLTDGNGDEKVFAKKLQRWIENGFRELGDYGGMGIGAHVHKVSSLLFTFLCIFKNDFT